jgi:hypothetical protein
LGGYLAYRVQVLIVWIVIGAASCGSPVYYDIPRENRPAFQSGDQFFYKADTGEADTFEVSLQQNYDVRDKQYHYEKLFLKFTLLRNGRAENEILEIDQSIGGVVIRGAMTHTEKLDSYILASGKEIYTVSHFVMDEASVTGIREVYYHYRYGIVKYIRSGGRSMDLQLHQ